MIAARRRRRGRTHNPGGPGLSAIAWTKDIAEFLGPDFDVVTVDPRGVGASGALDCGLPDDVFIRSLATQLRELGECGTSLGSQPRWYGTEEAVDDLEAIRVRDVLWRFLRTRRVGRMGCIGHLPAVRVR